MKPTGCLRTLAGKLVQRAEDVTGIEIQHRLRLDIRVRYAGRAARVAVAVHVIQKSADIFGSKIALQRPGCVGVAESLGEVWYVGVHHSLVGDLFREVYRHAIKNEPEAGHYFEHQPGRGHDDVGVELFARSEGDACLGEFRDLARYDRG